jgi:hypothetical protein
MRAWLIALGACTALALLAAPSAQAATATIDGTPLNITASDRGSIQVTFDGSATGEFLPQPSEPAYAGFNAILRRPSDNSASGFGYTAGGGFLFTPASPAPTVTGDGSTTSPFILTAAFDGIGGGPTPFVHVAEQIVYINGTSTVSVSYSITNTEPAGSALTGRLFESADLVVAGNDSGIGTFSAAPIRQVGAVNPLGTGAASMLEVSPWTHYQEGALSTIQNTVNNRSTTPPNLADAVDPGLVDAAAAVQWDVSLGAGQSTGESVIWSFTRTSPLQLVAVQPTRATGQIATVTVAARNADGSPNAGRSVRYAITGANPGTGAVTTAADGTGAISWTGANTGVDTLTAFVDINGDGRRDVNTEPQATATITWTPPAPPVPGKSVVAKVVSGTVLIKYPPGFVPRGAQAAVASGFIPFKGAANVPVGSQLDTSKGRVKLTSAADTGGAKTQASDFYDGIFQVKQSVPKKKPKKPAPLITDIVLKGELPRSSCAPLKGASAATVDKKKGPKGVLGKLWGSGKGKYRTKGQYSSATVRGTIWLTQDECDGTLTKVKRGTVQVRDFKRKKTVTVKAGHSYLARAARAASKSKRR